MESQRVPRSRVAEPVLAKKSSKGSLKATKGWLHVNHNNLLSVLNLVTQMKCNKNSHSVASVLRLPTPWGW